MAHNAYIRGSIGAWATGTQVSQAEFWQMDQYIYGAVNGDVGGTWAPSAVITIAGANGLSVSTGTPFVAAGPVTLSDTTTAATVNVTTLNVSGVTTLSGTTNAAAVNPSSLSVSGNSTLGTNAANTATVNATTTFASPVTYSAAATFNAAVVATDSVSCTGAATLNTESTVTSTLVGNNLLGSAPGSTGTSTKIVGDLISDGNGGRVAFSTLNIGNANLSTGYHYRFIAAPTVLRTLSLSLPGARAGTEFHVHNFGSAVLDIHIGGSLFTSLVAQSSTTIMYDGVNWYDVIQLHP